MYIKFFTFCFYRKGGKLRFRFASPFQADETRVLPKDGKDVKIRVLPYIRGGLVFSGIFALLLLTVAIVLTCLHLSVFYLWGGVPYAVYIFLLNLLPAQYASGKTDSLVYAEVKKDFPEGKAFLSAMEIQGRLSAGESYAEMPLSLYATDGLREDSQLYAVLWEANYRYRLEKKDFDGAADALNRLVVSAEYLTGEERETVWIETAYMFLLQGDASQLKRLLEEDEALLRSDDYRIKRLLATYAYACGEKEKGDALVAQAEKALSAEEMNGVRKHEKQLLSRLGA